ncbi:MAG: hypothetical protein R6X25_12110 [Candidatus Krumholzibacteriia bacterium]
MTNTSRQFVPRGLLRVAAGLAVLLGLGLLASPATAWYDVDDAITPEMHARGGFVLDGSYVMNVGELHVNITNWGLIGSWPGSRNRFSESPSAQWPAGSQDEYLFAAGLWVGGVVLGEKRVSTGQYEYEFQPLQDPEYTIYEAIDGVLMRPPGNPDASGRRAPDPDRDDDEDGLVDEETLNGFDDDGDGKIDEDFGQIGNQMFVATMFDNTRLSQERFPDHSPLNLQVVQKSFAWENDQADDFVGFEFTIKNIGVTDINNVYIGFFADSDIGPRGTGGVASNDMAGYFNSVVKASDGSFVPIAMGYMWDAAEPPLEGYFGIVFLDHPTDPSGQNAPPTVGLRSYNHFSDQAPFERGGDPTNDSERYTLLSESVFDNNVQPGKEGDYRFVISVGPFRRLRPDAELTFQVAMVVGPGLEGLLSHAADAYLTYSGNFFDEVPPVMSQAGDELSTGTLGRETKICKEDFADGGDFDRFLVDLGDTTCVDPLWALNQANLRNEEFTFIDSETGKTCAYVNMDNCFECLRQVGHYCTAAGREIELGDWNCNDPDIPEDAKAGCTGVAGRETQVTWLVGMAPPPPGMRLWPADNRVHIFWDDRSEVTPDVRLGMVDFESYRIWRADNWRRPFGSSLENGPESSLWSLIAEYDLVNYYLNSWQQGSQTVVDTLPLGRNTGLDAIRYRPRVLDDPQNAGLDTLMLNLVTADSSGRYKDMPPLFEADGSTPNRNFPSELIWPLVHWRDRPAVLDTFWAVTPREGSFDPPVMAKHGTSYYQYVDTDINNGFIYFYSVTATDHDIVFDATAGSASIRGAGQSGNPGSSFSNTTPGPNAQTAEERERDGVNIYVYPNPATRQALEDFQRLSPNAEDPTGVRVMFTNLPSARNTIDIFTLSGDLVQTLFHDGTDGYGQVSWNLVSRNGQEIVSGIYLYSVRSSDDRFDDYIGKFVVVR